MLLLLFWIECVGKGLVPWHVEAQTSQQLEELRVAGARELEDILWQMLKQRHGQNVGTTSPIARANILACISTTIDTKLGKKHGTSYTLRYERHGTWETLVLYKDGWENSVFGIPVASLSLRSQRNIRELLRL